jgi:hypothetical protein
MIEFWNDRFAEPGFAYGRQPNAFFAERLGAVGVGRVLLPAEGEGRNAVWAASRGWSVTAFDLSHVARDKALEFADGAGVDIDYRLASLTDPWPEGPGVFDVVGLVFVHVPSALRPLIHRAALLACRPGGRVILQGFTPRQLETGRGGPKDPDMLYTADDLREDFAGGEILHLEERLVELTEGRYHQGQSAVVEAEILRPDSSLRE